MRESVCVLTFIMLFGLSAAVFAGSFKVYPGARVEGVYEAKQPQLPGKTPKTSKEIVFTTTDPFESVVAFYSGIAREYRIPGRTGHATKLFSGEELKEAYFIFDNAPDIMSSEHWIKIQRPYLGRTPMSQGFQGKYEKVHEITAIIEEDKRSYP